MMVPDRRSNTIQYMSSYEQQKLWRHGIKWSDPTVKRSGFAGRTVDSSWNVMAHAQKPDFVFRRNGLVHLNRQWGVVSFQSTTGSRGVRISGSNAGYTMFRGSVKSTVSLLHSPVSPSLPLMCVTVCHHISTGAYHGEVLTAAYYCEIRKALQRKSGRHLKGFLGCYTEARTSHEA